MVNYQAITALVNLIPAIGLTAAVATTAAAHRGRAHSGLWS